MFHKVDPDVNFPKLETKYLEHWYKAGIIDKYIQKNEKNNKPKRFSFLDGPITANNPMGVHHAWGRTYKDIYQRFWNMRGYQGRFQNGFDCQGLWVEVEVEKELGLKSKKDIENLIPGNKKASIAKFIELCKQRVIKYANIQSQQSKKLGYFVDWDKSYFTMSQANNYMIWKFIKKCDQLGYLYKGIDSVPWCPRCGTAISQHEMLTEDYKEVSHDSIFFKLPISKSPIKLPKNTNFLAWTTTPWTIPANVALAIHPDYTYGIYQNTKSKTHIIFIYKDDQNQIPTRNNLTVPDYVFNNIQEKYTLIDKISGKKLIGTQYQGAFDSLPRVKKAQQENPDTFHTVVNGKDLVTSLEGTGIVHVAPGAGQEDFQLGKKENLPVIEVIDEEANYLKGMDDFTNKNAKNEPEIILKHLKIYKQGKHWFKKQKIKHRYPACWRCKTELVWRVVDEWYIAMDKKPNTSKHSNTPNKTLRKQMIDIAKQINWMPKFGLKRELDWLNNMQDWLISKKRYWGLALPIWECKKCGNFEVIGSKEELNEKAITGIKALNKHTPHRPYIDEVKIKCSKCQQVMSRIPDVGNPWLDAGIVPYSTITDQTTPPRPEKPNQQLNKTKLPIDTGTPLYLTNKKAWKKWFPADFITESFPGQFKNWFYSMIAMSTVLENEAPYKNVLGFGTLLAEDGKAMHKSWGNAIEFNQGAEEIGVDVMRFMYAITNPAENMLFGPNTASLIRRKFHLLLWNTYNFFITYALVNKWTPSKQKLPNKKTHNSNILDIWIINRLNQTINTVTDSLEKYDTMTAAQALLEFVSDFSTWYVRLSRTRLGPNIKNNSDKNSCFTTIFHVLTQISKLLAPITPFIAEEIYTNLTNQESVHLTDWCKKSKPKDIDTKLIANMIKTRKIVEKGHASRKQQNINVRQPLANITVNVPFTPLEAQFEQLILKELNIKTITWKKTTDTKISVKLDTNITPQLKAEGQAREIIRQIQIARKKANCDLSEQVIVQLPSWPIEHEAFIKSQTLATKLTKGKTLSILKT